MTDQCGLGAGNKAMQMPGSDADRRLRAETAARAARYLIRTGNRDLLPILGLDRVPAGGAA